MPDSSLGGLACPFPPEQERPAKLRGPLALGFGLNSAPACFSDTVVRSSAFCLLAGKLREVTLYLLSWFRSSSEPLLPYSQEADAIRV